MRLNPVAVNRSRVKLHFLRKDIRNNSKEISLVIGSPFPVILKGRKRNELIGPPLLKDKRARSHRPSVKLTLANPELGRITPAPQRLLLQGLIV